MAAQDAELKLRVSLDLTSLRRQLNTVGTSLDGQPLYVPFKFDRKLIANEYRLLSRYISGKTFDVKIESKTLKTLSAKVKNFQERLKTLEGVNIEVGVGVVQSLSQRDARRIKSGLRTAVLDGSKKILVPTTITPRITGKDVDAFKAAVKEKLSGISVDVKANVQGGGFAGSPQGAAGLMEFMQSQGMIGKIASGMEMRMKKGGDDLSRDLDDAVKSAEKIKATFDGIAKSIATTGKTTANVQGKRLGLGNVPLMSGSIERRIERAASSIAGTLSSDVLKLLYPEINKAISSFTALRGQVQQNASKLSGFSLIIGLAAFAGVPLAKSVVKLTGSANDFAKLLDGLGPKLESAFLKAASNILKASSTRLLTGGRLAGLLSPAAGPAGLLPPAYRGIGPSRNAGALPPAYRGIGPAAEPVGLLPRYTSRGARDEAMRQIGAGEEGAGKLALTDEMVRRRSPIQAARVREIFDPREFEFGTLRLFRVIGDALEQAAGQAQQAADQAKKARIHRSVDELMRSIDDAIKVAQARVRVGRGLLTGQTRVTDLGRSALPSVQPALPSTRIAGLLSAEPPGRYRAGRTEETQAELFARREREARMRSALRSVDVMGETPTRAPARYSYANRPAMPRPPTSAIVPYGEGGALARTAPRPQRGGGAFPSDGMRGPSTQLGAGYFAVGKGLQSIKQAYAGVKPFLDTKKLPLSGAMAELGGEFGTAIKQVLLYGTAYKALAFFTSLPGQAFEAAKGLATYRNQLEAVTSESQTFDQSLAFVDNLAQRFNVPLDSARQGFVKLYASMRPAGFGQEQIEGLFTGISKAAAAFGLSADKVDRVNYAFAQMASKGQIMSEELKGQLGDVLPGALGLFAKAAQMSIPEFSKAMEDGAFKGDAMAQVLDNVAILMNNKFGPAAQGAAKTLQGAVNQIQNNLTLMYESFGPIVDRFAAIFGPQINGLIKDVTATMKVLTGTFTAAGEGFATLSPRAQAFYAAIQSLTPPLQQAGAAIADLGGRFATLLPAMVQAIAAAISFASSPLGRGAIIASVAIGTLTAAIKLLEATGLKAAIKAVYLFIGGLLKIPAATGVARVAIIGLKLALTGVFAGAILLGLDFLIGKLFNIGDAANDSAKDIKGMRKELDAMAGAGDIESTSKAFLDANTKLAAARKANQKALQELGRAKLAENLGDNPIAATAAVTAAQVKAEQAYAKVIEAQKEVQAAEKSRASAVALKERQDKETQDALTKIDLSGGDGTGKKPKEQSLESYYSLQNQLAKAQTQADIDRIQALFDHRKNLINSVYDLEEARANSIQKEAIAHQRAISNIFLDLQKKQIDARLSMMKAEGSVAGGAAPMGAAVSGKTGLFQGSTGVSSGPHFDVRRQDGAYISPEQAKALFDPSVRKQLAMTSAYGPRRAPVPGASTFHKGVDLAGPANTPLNLAAGYTMTGAGEKGRLGYAATVRGPQGEMYDVGHLQRPKAGAMAPQPVAGSVKRDVLADQAQVIAAKQATLSITHAEIEAQRQLVIETEKYLAQIFGVAEKEFQAGMLQKKTAMLRAGATDQEIEDAMSLEELNLKYAAGVEAANRQITFNNQLKEKNLISQEELNNRNAYQNLLIEKLNKELPKATQAQSTLNKASKEYAFTGKVKALQDEIKLLLIINSEERRLAELRAGGLSSAEAQKIFDLEKIKKNIEDTRALIDGFVSQTSSDYKGFLKAVISGEDAADALKQFQEGLKDRVLTIFLDFAMAPVEKFLKESLEGLFLPKAPKELKPEEEKAKTGIEGNTVATDKNTTAINNFTAALQGAGATSPTSAAAGGGIGGGIFDAANVFGGGGNLTGGIFDTISQQMGGATESLSSFSSHMSNFIDTGMASADAVGSWGDSFNTKLSDSLTKATDTTNEQGATFQESLGKAVSAIGIAAGAIMGIAAGIGQIKKGGASNILGGIGSVLLSVGGAIGGFASLFPGKKAANGAVWKGGFQAFANGGTVTGPTLGLVGEGKYNEAIVPLPDGRSIPVQMRGGSSRDLLNAPSSASAAPTMLSMSFQSTTINGVEYVDRAQLEAAMAETRKSAARDGASRGALLALDKLQNSPSARRRVGIR